MGREKAELEQGGDGGEQAEWFAPTRVAGFPGLGMESRILSLSIRRLPGSAVRPHCAWSEAAAFTAPSSAWLFLGSQPASRNCSWNCSTLWKSGAKKSSKHLAKCWVKRPSQAHRDFGRTIQAGLGQPPMPSCIPTAFSICTASKAGTCGKSIPDSPVLQTHPEHQPLLHPRWQREHVTPKPQRGLHTQVLQAASVCGFPKFWLQGYNPLLCPLNMEIQERENGGCFLSWELS